MCKTLMVSRSGFYAWLGRSLSARAREDHRLTELIREAFAECRHVYGSPRIHHLLARRGVRCGRKRVARLMRQAGLHAIWPRRFRLKTTDSRHDLPVAPDLVRRNFSPTAKDQVWVSDITFIETEEGWLYLASTMDLFSRRIVGWSMSDSLRATLVVDAMKMALGRRQPPGGLIHHSDRGSQYASAEFRALLATHSVKRSMGRSGNCYDNAVKESFFHSLKAELVRRTQFSSRQQATLLVFDYIESFYNRQRLHSTLGYLSPVEFEAATELVA